MGEKTKYIRNLINKAGYYVLIFLLNISSLPSNLVSLPYESLSIKPKQFLRIKIYMDCFTLEAMNIFILLRKNVDF